MASWRSLLDLANLKDRVYSPQFCLNIIHRKSMVGDYSQAQLKVRDMTNNDPWGCTPQEMHTLCHELNNAEARHDILQAINERWTDENSTWRNLYKTLVLFEYLVLHGPDTFANGMAKDFGQDGRTLKMLTQYEYTDSKGKNQGINVKTRAEKLTSLLKDPEALRTARREAGENRKIMLSRKNDSDLSNYQKPSFRLMKNSTPSMEPLSPEDEPSDRPIPNVAVSAPRACKMPSINLIGMEDAVIGPNANDKFNEPDGLDEFDDFQSAEPSPTNENSPDADEFDDFQQADNPTKYGSTKQAGNCSKTNNSTKDSASASASASASDSLEGYLKMHANLVDLHDDN
ncbi:hypothetical protein PSACC_03213 [Paramicrosporidium saccamoebae]|uniref:ENTH domain-containing protein n=1 Tax=Paramicrosporidium saccamoebae TaxID=1246581 RepID=A0A2H9TGU6_9FUNG|nr:hypothetical protein PSACC_03213 [Paramicrosporidium saccamoebae]